MKCLLIGANSDIAFHFSKLLAKNKYELILTSRNLDELYKKKDQIENLYNNKIKVLQFDIQKFENYNSFFELLDKDIEIIFISSGYLEETEKNKEKIIDTNYNAPKKLIEYIFNNSCFKNLKNLICISSIAANRLDFADQSYSLAKKKLSDYLYQEYKKKIDQGIAITNIKPGYVNTKMTKNLNLPKFLISSPLSIANEIFINMNNKKEHEVIVPKYWKILVQLFNLKVFLLKKINFKNK